MAKKIMITPYFGKMPEWMDKYEQPKGYDWLLDTDLDSFKDRVKRVLGIECEIQEGTGKLWDFRCALGLLYADEIKDYDFWGHTDFDCVYGDVKKWFPDSFLENLDVHSNHHSYVCGFWTTYRNVPEVNELFRFIPKWESYMQGTIPNGWVEEEYSRTLEKSGLRYKYTYEQGNPYTSSPNLKKIDGKLYQDNKEIPMFHFRMSKKWPIPTK